MNLLSRLLIFSIAIVLFFPSCKTCLQASADFAKDEEALGSPVSEFEKLDYNIMIWCEEFITGIPYVSSVDQKAYASDYSQGSGLLVREGLEYVGKGGKYAQGGGKINLNYLEVPIYGMYKHALNWSSSIYGGLGPFFSYGIGGKVKGPGFNTPSFGENNGGYKRFDGGVSFLVGYQYENFFFSVSYDLGLANTAYPSTDISSKTRSLGINIAYSIQDLIKKK